MKQHDAMAVVTRDLANRWHAIADRYDRLAGMPAGEERDREDCDLFITVDNEGLGCNRATAEKLFESAKRRNEERYKTAAYARQCEKDRAERAALSAFLASAFAGDPNAQREIARRLGVA